jgi:hypothetical protein
MKQAHDAIQSFYSCLPEWAQEEVACLLASAEAWEIYGDELVSAFEDVISRTKTHSDSASPDAGLETANAHIHDGLIRLGTVVGCLERVRAVGGNTEQFESVLKTFVKSLSLMEAHRKTIWLAHAPLSRQARPNLPTSSEVILRQILARGS